MPTSRPALRRTSPRRSATDLVLDTNDATLLDVVDNALTKGVVVNGEMVFALADVDLIYARLSLLLCDANRVLPTPDAPRRRRR